MGDGGAAVGAGAAVDAGEVGRLAGSAGGHSASYGSVSHRFMSASRVLPAESRVLCISSPSAPSSDSIPPNMLERPDSSNSKRPTLRAKSPSASPIIGVSEPDLSALARLPTGPLASDTNSFAARIEPSRSPAAPDASANRSSISSPDTDDSS